MTPPPPATMSNPANPSSTSSFQKQSSNVVIDEAERIKKMTTRPVCPPGYRFVPRDQELICFYLRNKLSDRRLFHDLIPEVKLYDFSPQKLSEDYLALGEQKWYFFSPRDRKYVNGKRPNRKAGDGYWKATGKEKDIVNNNEVVGFERALVYYVGKPPHGAKSDWIMHEYRLNAPPRAKSCPEDMKLDDCVLCKIYQKPSGSNSKKNLKAEKGAIVPVEMEEHNVLEHSHLGSAENENNYPKLLSAQDHQEQLFMYNRIPQNGQMFMSKQQQQQQQQQMGMNQGYYGVLQANDYGAALSTHLVSNYHHQNLKRVRLGDYGISPVPSEASLAESSNARSYGYPHMLNMPPHCYYESSGVADTPFSQVPQSDNGHEIVNKHQECDGFSNASLPDIPSEEAMFSSSNNSDDAWTVTSQMDGFLSSDSLSDMFY